MKKLLPLLMTLLATACASSQPAPQQDLYPVEFYKTDKGGWVELDLIYHGCVALSYKGFDIQIDPVAGRGDNAYDYSVFPKPEMIMVTHEHGDHFSSPTIESLETEGTRIIVNQTVFNSFQRGEVRKNGDSEQLAKGVKVDYVPAYNITPGRENFHPKGNGNGFVFDIDGFRIYVSGDTECIPEMANLKDIDVALLSTNLPYTMSVEQCIEAAKTIKPKVLIPYHLSNTDLQAIKDGLEGTGIDVHLYENLR